MSREKIPTSRLTLVCVDAMFTIFKPKRFGRRRMICEAYRRSGGLERGVTNQAIWNTILEERQRFRELKGYEDYWLHVNLAVFRSLPAAPGRHKSDYQAAQDVHRRITCDASLYEPDAAIIRLILWLRERGVRVVIGSNQEEANLARLLRQHRLRELFGQVYTSEALGTRKPYPEFWQRILAAEGAGTNEALHIGNSPNSDIGAARLGIRTLLWDRQGDIRAVLRSKKGFHLAHPDVDEDEFFRLLHSGLVQSFNSHRQAMEVLRCCLPAPASIAG